MNTHADKKSENKSQAIANSLPKLQSNGKFAFLFVDNKPEAVAQREMHELANNSPQVSQLRSLQQMANNSPQAKQAGQMQALANAKAEPPMRKRKENGIIQLSQAPEKEELIQGKFESVQRQGNDSDSKPRENKTGLPDNLKTGIESLSGLSLDHVKVHYIYAQSLLELISLHPLIRSEMLRQAWEL